MGNQSLRRITVDGVLIALFLVLGLLRIRVGDFLEIGLGTLVITLAAIAISPLDAFVIGFLGEFLNQILFSGYGFTPTTPLWCLPPAIRGLIIGLVAYLYARKGDALIKHKAIYFTTIFGTALLISALDTGLLLLDGLIMGYPVAMTWIKVGIRVLTSQVTALIVSLVCIPLYRAVVFFLPRKETKAKEQNESDQTTAN